jgi:putative hemolysin
MISKEPAKKFADVRSHLPFLARHEVLAGALEKILRYPEVRQAFVDSAEENNPFMGVAQRLGLKFRIEGLAEKIPATGPVVVVANHGHGGADALALMAAMCDLRPDFKVLANREVTLLPGVEPAIIPVSVLTSGDSRENSASLRAMLKHVRGEGALGVFPAGRVAFWKGDRMTDPPWNDHVIKLLQRMEAAIVPLWFYGNPPSAINFLSRLSSFLRIALIPTGLALMKGEISARAGEPLSTRALKERGDEAGAWLREKLQSLSDLGN